MSRPPRKWSDLRGTVEAAPASTEEPIEQVLRRLFCTTTDGQRVLNWMVETSHAASPPGCEDRALREREGARRFIANIRSLATGDHAAKPAHRTDD